MKTIRVFISGTVQGMLFKKHIEEQARLMGVRGYVRSMQDGRLEAVFEGLDDRVLQMIEICKAGNAHAKIRDVELKPLNHQGFEGFSIMKL